MTCSNVVQDKVLKKNAENQSEEIEEVIEVETSTKETLNKRSINNNEKNDKGNNCAVELKKNLKIRPHSQSHQTHATSGIGKCVLWIRRMNES